MFGAHDFTILWKPGINVGNIERLLRSYRNVYKVQSELMAYLSSR